ncbi:hypothetical protein Peur_047315 [Populus x canadensis]
MHFLACQIAPVPVQSACYFVTFFFSSMAAILAAYFPPASNGLCPVTVEFLVLGACCALRLKERFRRCLWSISAFKTYVVVAFGLPFQGGSALSVLH